MLWIDSIYFIALGCLSGFLAGLLGVGGGIVVVPCLFLIFHLLDFPAGELMHVAIGTSLASMIISSISATISQHKKKAILWDLIKTFGPALSIGAVIGALIAHYLPSHLLARIFGVFTILLAVYLFLPRPPELHLKKAKRLIMSLLGLVIGTLGSLLGVSGGVFTVPVLSGLGVPIRNSVATSTASVIFTSLIGSVSFLILGWGLIPNKETLGYIYIPGFLAIGIASLIVAPFGVKVSHALPTKILRRIFACLLAILGIAMLFH